MTGKQSASVSEASLLERLIPAFTASLEHQRRAAEQITSLNAVHTTGLQPRPLVLSGATPAVASQRVTTSAGTLRGWSLREIAGGTAVVRIHLGQDVNGDLLLTIALAAGESTRDFPTHGLAYPAGLYVEVVSGSIEGTLFIGPVGV